MHCGIMMQTLSLHMYVVMEVQNDRACFVMLMQFCHFGMIRIYLWPISSNAREGRQECGKCHFLKQELQK